MEKIECCNIWKKECFINLKDEEKICPNCHGQGAFFLRAHFKQRCFDVGICRMCWGSGKVDWITYITKTYGFLINFRHVKEISMKCHRNKKCKRVKRLFLDQNRR